VRGAGTVKNFQPTQDSRAHKLPTEKQLKRNSCLFSCLRVCVVHQV